MNILSLLHNNWFDSLQEDEKNEAEKEGELMVCTILYLDNWYKVRFYNLKKYVENDYVLNKVEYPKAVSGVQSLLLNYQPNYNSDIKSQSNEVGNQFMFAQREKTGDNEGNRKKGAETEGKSGSHHLQWMWRKGSLW